MGTPTPKEIFSVFWAFLVETKKIAKGFLGRNFKLRSPFVIKLSRNFDVEKFFTSHSVEARLGAATPKN